MRNDDRIPLTPVQNALWTAAANSGRPGRATAGALRVSGDISAPDLIVAIGTVVETNAILRTGFGDGPDGPVMILESGRPSILTSAPEDDAHCLRILVGDRDTVAPLTGPRIRVHVMELGPREFVIAVIADPLVLDLRSSYLMLGSVLQAALGRYRPDPGTGIHEVWSAAAERQAGLTTARRAWWTERLLRWSDTSRAHQADRAAPAAPVRNRRLRLGATSTAAGHRAPGWNEVIAELAWAMREEDATSPAPVVFTGGLDLREVLGLPAAMGPLTDQVVFDLDLRDLRDPRPDRLITLARASMLDAVVHHVPYTQLESLGGELGTAIPPDPACADHVLVHHCRLPPSSRHTRGDPGLARLGLSVELFGQAELVSASSAAAAAVEVHLAESRTDLELIWDHDPSVVSPGRADAILARMQRRLGAAAEPTFQAHEP